MRSVIKELFQGLNDFNISYSVLRGYEELPEKVSHDIDLCIARKDLTKALDIITKVMDSNAYFEVQSSSRQGFSQIYFYGSEGCLKLDFWIEFKFRGLFYLDANELLKNIKYHNNIAVLNESAELTVSFLKEFLHNGVMRQDKITSLSSMAKNYNFLFEGVCKEDIFEAELYRGKLLRKDIDFMKHRKRFLSNLISFNLRQVGIIKTIYSLFDYCIRKIVDNLRRRNIFLVLLGPDGSGKTTMAKFLIDEAKEKNSSFTNINYIHGRWGFIPNLGSLKGDSREVVSTLQFETVEQVTKLYPHSRKRVSVYMGYYFIDYLLGSLKLNLSRGENCLVVADRHYYDYFITEHFRHYPKIFELIYFKLIQSPDLVVYLKADAEEIRKRKPELTIEQIRYQQKRIEYLRNCIPNLVSIETNNKNQSMQQLNMLINKKRSRGNDHFDENIDSE